MRQHTSTSRCDIGLLVLCIAVALVSLGAVGSRGRTRAREAVCHAHLRQWASVFDSLTRDHDFLFARAANSRGSWWIEATWSYHGDTGLLLCPSASEFLPDSPTCSTWRTGGHQGSYGLNGWVSDPAPGTPRDPSACWGTSRVWDADRVPVLADMFWVDAWPYYTDVPPANEQQFPAADGANEMQRVCINRHDGAVNVLFMDWSVRKVGLKELWALRWSRRFNPQGPWTVAGGVSPEDWPAWMRPFKDFEESEDE